MTDTPDSVFVFTVGDPATAEMPAPLPPGEYRAIVRKAAIAESKAGNQMLVLTYYVSPDQYPTDYTDGDPDGETLINRFTLMNTPKGCFRMRRFYESHGLPAKREARPVDFFNIEVIINVEHEMYEGEPRATVRSVRPA